MKKKFILEVCAFNIESCIIAEQAGAARVELCADPLQGGTTPSYGTILEARERIAIQLYPIIRPRGGDFLYDAEEYEVMKRDILLCKQLGCDGIVTGIQLPDGSIDTERMKRIAALAYPMEVACHRVFDLTPDPFKALEDIIECGYERILTSGQKSSAADATDLLAQLVAQAGSRISIMPGGGVRSGNIQQLITTTGAKEFHTSARKAKEHINPVHSDVLKLGDVYIADEAELKHIMQIGNALLNIEAEPA